jgi:RNA methyltransferase, TrmH family
MQPVTSPQNPTVKLIRSLDDKKGRREAGLFVAEGVAMLERAMALGWTPQHVVATRDPFLWDDVRPMIISEKLMGELSAQNNPHEVLATFRQRWQPHAGRESLWLALEEVRDPGNLGTILRTADAVGAAGVILVGEYCDPYSGECVRASTGSIFAMPIVRMSAEAFIDFAKGAKGPIVGTSGAASKSFRKDYPADVLLVMGSEARGLSDSVSKTCTELVRIPMREGVESLNLATATALMLYQVRQG